MLKTLSALGVASLMLLSAPSIAEPTRANTLAVKGQFEFSSLDPTRKGYVYQRMQVLETLVNVDHQGNLIPGLARDWQVDASGKVWIFTLQSGVRFHDGSELDAEAVASSLNIAYKKPSLMQGAPITTIEALDKQRIKVSLSKPYSPLPAILANYSTAILAPSAFDAEDKVVAVIGSGPFSAYEVSIPHKLVVKKFDQYWGQKASIEYASYLAGHRVESRVLQARSGEGHIVLGIDAAAVPGLKRIPHLDIVRSDLPRSMAVKMNLAHPLLADQKSREAMSLAIDRKGIATAILRSKEAASAQLLPSYMADWYVNNASAERNVEQASALLKAQGWQKNDEGWLVKGDKAFELSLITYSDRPELVKVATALQDQWKRVGIKLNVNITNFTEIPSGHQDGSLELALIARNYGTIADPLGILIKDFGNAKGGDWGSMNWSNPQIQTTLNQLVQENNPEKYHQQAQQVAEAIYKDKPLLPIAYYVQHTAVNKKVKGFRFDPYERSLYLNELTWNK